MPSATSRSERVDAARNRSLILDAARAMLAEGDDLPGMNALAKRAGVGVGTVYRHFPDPQVLIEGLAEGSFSRLVDDARKATLEEDPAVGFAQLMHAALRQLLRDPGLAAVLRSRQPVCPETLDMSAAFQQAMSDLLQRAREAGAIRGDIDPGDLRRLLVGVHAAALAGGRQRDAAGRYLDVVLAGLRS
jgi:AcrR family transcriptional regulator